MEIEELKTELSQIIITQTPSGRDKWDTPEIKLPGGRKGRLRKDRYSSLLMANMTARTIEREIKHDLSCSTGGFATSFMGQRDKLQGQMYSGPESLVQKLQALYA